MNTFITSHRLERAEKNALSWIEHIYLELITKICTNISLHYELFSSMFNSTDIFAIRNLKFAWRQSMSLNIRKELVQQIQYISKISLTNPKSIKNYSQQVLGDF